MLISLAVPIDEVIELGDELIVYSRKSADYIGVGGAGKTLLDALVRLRGTVSSEVLFASVLGRVENSFSERTILEEALRVLVEEGLCNEQS